MKLAYKKIRIEPTPAFPKRKYYLRPIIPIRLSYKNQAIRYEALLDSGADFCIFHAEIGDFLQIPIVKGEREIFGGIVGQSSTAYFHNLDITIAGNRYKNIPIGFSYDISPHGYGILGHYAFFDLFRIILDVKKEQIELREKN